MRPALHSYRFLLRYAPLQSTCLAIIIALLVALNGPVSLRAQDPASPAPLHLMPLPRSVQSGTGELNLSQHFNAGFSGLHDARLDAALDRMLLRLDRQCGEIRRSQASTVVAAASPLLLI